MNLGLDYGVVTDLWDMLRRGHIDIGSELVVGLNYLTLYDDLETNPSYLWHRGTLEPYVYFQRDDLFQLCKDAAKAVLGREASGYGGVRALVRREEVPAGLELERATVEDIILFMVKGAK